MLSIAGRGGIETTVDQTLMRGLNTAGPWFVSGLPLSHMARVAVSGSQNHNEGCPDRPPRPAISSVMELNLSPLYLAPLHQVAFVGGMGIVVAIAQTKAASSRAMATMTMLVGRPLACMRRYRWHSRTCAFQAVALIASGSPSVRFKISWPTRAGNL